MKNVHILSTDKPSRLSILNSGKLNFGSEIMSSSNSKPQHIYITSDEEIKDCWVLNTNTNEVYFLKGYYGLQPISKKIILTTDQDLINDGVQAIDDEFLEWFVKNPSCEQVEVKKVEFEVDMGLGDSCIEYGNYYNIIIPKEEPKTLTKLEIARNIAAIGIGKKEEPKQETLEDELWGNVFAKIKQYGLNNEVLTILKQKFNISKR